MCWTTKKFWEIQSIWHGDLFRIETVQQYPLEHEPLVEMADEEQNSNARPELLNRVENMEQYDTIFFGLSQLVGGYADAALYVP